MTRAIVVLTTVLQLVAVWRALHVVALTRRHTVSILLVAAVGAMAGRSALVLTNEALGARAVDAAVELPVCAISALILAAIGVLEPLLRSVKTLNAAVRDSERRLEGVIGALAEGVIVRDGQGIIRTCNASAEGRPPSAGLERGPRLRPRVRASFSGPVHGLTGAWTRVTVVVRHAPELPVGLRCVPADLAQPEERARRESAHA